VGGATRSLRPEGVPIADAVRPVADGVARGHFDVRLGPANLLADEGAQGREALVGYRGKAHGRLLCALTQRFTVDLSRRRARQVVDELHAARVFVPAEACLDEVLDLGREGGVAPIGHEVGAGNLAAHGIRDSDHRGFPDVRVREQRILDLDRAHRPAGRDDGVVGASAVMKIAVRVDMSAVFDLEPARPAFHRDLPIDVGRADRYTGVVQDGDVPSGCRLAERARTDGVAGEAGVVDEDHPDLRAAVHAARCHPQGTLDELARARIHGLARERDLVEAQRVTFDEPGASEQAIDGGRRREVGDLEALERLQQASALELSGVRAHRDAEGEGGDGAVPETMTPCR
jgi:hypothetical protein